MAAATSPAAVPPAAAPRSGDPPPTAERRFVTVLFADLVGFTTFAEDRDPETVRELLSRYFDTVTAIVVRHGGTVEKFIGDAVMAVWGTPVAHEDDGERAVRAGLEVVDAVEGLAAGLRARCGLLTGEAAVTLGAQNQGMVAGDLVNTAARLQGVAEPGTVLVGEATMRAAAGAVVFEPIGDHSLKGKTAPVPAWRALRVVSGRGGHGRQDALEPPFVGREEELRLLKEQLHAVGRDNRVRLVSLSGPAGIGKSRLAWELEKYVDGVTEDVYWHRGRSPSYGEGATFWALGEMVRRRIGLSEGDDETVTRDRAAAAVTQFVADPVERERILAALLALLGVEEAPVGGRDVLFPAWRAFFERIAARGTTVLVFEDLHWADAGLLEFIDHVIEWSRALPILVVTLARPELLDKRPDWGAGRRNYTAMTLEPLADDAVRDLLSGLVPGLPAATVDAIVRRADGIPLYAVETVRALLADGRIRREGDVYQPAGDLSTLTVPESLRSLIASRLDALNPGDRSLVQDAAVLGQVFAVDALAAIAGLSVSEVEVRLRDLVRRELVDIETDPQSPERGQYKFVQALIREVAYGTLARRDRRARHLAVARHYEATSDDETAGILASHYVAAHDASDEGPEADAIAAQARLALSAAAARAADLGAHDQAVRYLEQALAVTASVRDRAVLFELAAASAVTASLPHAETLARSAIGAYEEVGDELSVLRSRTRLGQLLIEVGDLKQGLRELEAVLPLVEGTRDRAVLAETLATLARAYMRTAEHERAVATADRALAIAEVDNLEPIVAEAFINKGSSLSALGRRREAVTLLAAAIDLAHRVSPPPVAMRARNNLASCMTEDDPAGATRLVLETIPMAADLGDRGHYAWLVGTAGFGRFFEGREWDEHLAMARDAFERVAARYDRCRLRGNYAMFEAARGERIDEILPELDAIVADETEPDMLSFRLIAASDVAFARGDMIAACDLAIAAADLPTQMPELGYTIAIRGAAHARDLDRARSVADKLARSLLTGPLTGAARDHADGVVAALEGRRDDALADFRRAHDTLIALQQRFEAAQFALDAVVLLPEEPEVRARAADARRLCVDLRASVYVARFDAALGAHAPEGGPGPSDARGATSTAVAAAGEHGRQ